jgi:hypothetical protein
MFVMIQSSQLQKIIGLSAEPSTLGKFTMLVFLWLLQTCYMYEGRSYILGAGWRLLWSHPQPSVATYSNTLHSPLRNPAPNYWFFSLDGQLLVVSTAGRFRFWTQFVCIVGNWRCWQMVYSWMKEEGRPLFLKHGDYAFITCEPRACARDSLYVYSSVLMCTSKIHQCSPFGVEMRR